MFSMNSPGHYANSLMVRNLVHDFEDAIAFVKETAIRSIGNGGIGCPETGSTSWHRRVETKGCPSNDANRRPSHVPPDADEARYAALYHTDVLVASDVMSDHRRVRAPFEDEEVWSHLILDYITTQRFP